MNVPAIALKTFAELKHHAATLEFIQFVLKKLKKLGTPKKRAQFVHRMIDESNEQVFANPLIQQLSPCKKGCSACCHTQVSVTEDEASLLALRVNEGVTIDLERLKKQMVARDSSASYYSLSFETRKCVFLDEQGSCRVYEDRTSVCRNNAVIGSADQCDTSSGDVKSTRLVRTPEADLVTYAFFLNSPSSGSLPYMLARSLNLIDQ